MCTTIRAVKRKLHDTDQFPIVGLDFAEQQETDIDIIGQDANIEPASKRLKLTLEQLQCKLCLEHFSNARDLASHNCNRLKIVDYECPICHRSFMCSANLASHMKWHSQYNKAEQKRAKQFNCDQCNKSLSSKAYLDRHVQVIHAKMNKIPDSARKQRMRKKRPLASSESTSESTEPQQQQQQQHASNNAAKRLKKSEQSKSFYVENLLRKTKTENRAIKPVELAVNHDILFACTVTQNFVSMNVLLQRLLPPRHSK